MIVSVFKKKPVQRAALLSDIISTKHDLSCWFWMFVHNRRVSTEIKPQNWTVTRKRFVFNNSVMMIHSECLKLFKYSFLALSSFQRHNDTHTLYSWRGKTKKEKQWRQDHLVSPISNISLRVLVNQLVTLTLACRLTCHCCYRRIDRRLHSPVNLLQSKDHQETERQSSRSPLSENSLYLSPNVQ